MEGWFGCGILTVVLLIILCASVWWIHVQWVECREMGMSVLYCLKHVS